mmetsp:Transcript_32101/g.102232  ORF Transcript_32101/g.102232 Transcript_32101/m.102232 type:complete len:249 (-) Transcript_32101:805-1551(-)
MAFAPPRIALRTLTAPATPERSATRSTASLSLRACQSTPPCATPQAVQSASERSPVRPTAGGARREISASSRALATVTRSVTAASAMGPTSSAAPWASLSMRSTCVPRCRSWSPLLLLRATRAPPAPPFRKTPSPFRPWFPKRSLPPLSRLPGCPWRALRATPMARLGRARCPPALSPHPTAWYPRPLGSWWGHARPTRARMRPTPCPPWWAATQWCSRTPARRCAAPLSPPCSPRATRWRGQARQSA